MNAQTGWRIYQFLVVIGFLFADVYFEWGAGGLAAGVMGGIAAWWSTALLTVAWERLRGRAQSPSE